jgi:alpha-amylase
MLVGLRDLKLGTSYAREKVVDYLNKLVGYGVAGFRCAS